MIYKESSKRPCVAPPTMFALVLDISWILLVTTSFKHLKKKRKKKLFFIFEKIKIKELPKNFVGVSKPSKNC
jgi:hypothetical protein